MAKAFKNSKDKTYFIKSKKTKKGNTTYYMTKKEDDTCLDETPDGYEVFEKYDSGLMFIRKKQKSHFTLKEINAIRASLENNGSLIDFRLNIAGKQMTIYTADRSINEDRLQSLIAPFYTESQKSYYESVLKRFEARMKIIVHQDGAQKDFEVQRYCYRGSIDDWITIGSGSDIAEIGKSYLIHLGKESYYELFGY